jgi:hypothetical protein
MRATSAGAGFSTPVYRSKAAICSWISAACADSANTTPASKLPVRARHAAAFAEPVNALKSDRDLDGIARFTLSIYLPLLET